MKSNALKPNEGKLLIESRLEVNYPSKQNVYGFLKKHIVQNVQRNTGLVKLHEIRVSFDVNGHHCSIPSDLVQVRAKDVSCPRHCDLPLNRSKMHGCQFRDGIQYVFI